MSVDGTMPWVTTEKSFTLRFILRSQAKSKKMLKKLEWIKTWLPQKAPQINRLTTKNKSAFFWVQSSNFNIPKHTTQYKMIVQKKILPMPIWDYSQIK